MIRPALVGHVYVCRYLLVALCVTCLYSLLTALGSLKLISGSASAAKTVFLLLLLDVVSTAPPSIK